VAVKDIFSKGIINSTSWQWQGGRNYTVQKGYLWLLGEMEYKRWSKAIWVRTVTPRHSSTTWLFINQRIPVKSRLDRFMNQDIGTMCGICEVKEEDSDHLFFQCQWAKEYWHQLQAWWPIPVDTTSTGNFMHSMQKLKGPEAKA